MIDINNNPFQVALYAVDDRLGDAIEYRSFATEGEMREFFANPMPEGTGGVRICRFEGKDLP